MEYAQIDGLIAEGSNPKLNNSDRLRANKGALYLLCSAKNDTLTRSRIFKICVNFQQLEQKWNLKRSIQIVLSKSLQSGYIPDIARANKCFGSYYLSINNIDSAYCFYVRACKFYQKAGDKKKLGDCLYKIAGIEYDVSDYGKAEQSAVQALKLAHITNNKASEYCAQNMLAIISNRNNDYEGALAKHKQAFKLLGNYKIDINNYRECSLNNMGGVYQSQNLDHKAIDYFSAGLMTKGLQQKDPELYAALIDNLAYSKLKLGECERAFPLLEQALSIRKNNKYNIGIITSYLHLSDYNLQIFDSVAARNFAVKAFNTSKCIKSPSSTLISLKQLIVVDKKHLNRYIDDYVALSDSLQLAERKTRNKFARIAYETDEITHEKDNAVKQKWIAYSASGMSIVIGGLLLLVRVQRSKQRELLFEQEQQKSNESIYRLINDQQIRIDEARQAEKTRIAQELHDGVMNRLASTRLNLFVLNKQKDDQTIKKCISLIDGIQDIEKEIRQVAHDLNHEIFSGNNSFHTLLEALFESQKTGSAAAMYSESDQSINWAQIDSAVKMNIYRILQEALQNANKHAKAKNIFVTVSRDESEDIIHINVYDDGIGFNPAKNKGGIGMKNMRERVAAINGKFEIQSPMGKGTNLRIAVPVRRIV
jgi:signal transduction histidine kinase